MRATDQFASDASFLERFVHCEVGQVRAIAEIRDCSRDTYESFVHSSRRNDVCVAKHLPYDVGSIDGAPFSKSRPDEHVDELVR